MGGLEGGSHLLSWGPQRGTPSSNYTPLPHLSAALALQGARALVGQSFARGSASSRLRPRDPLTAGLRAESCGSRTRRRRASARPCSRPRLGRLRLGQVHRRPPPSAAGALIGSPRPARHGCGGPPAGARARPLPAARPPGAGCAAENCGLRASGAAAEVRKSPRGEPAPQLPAPGPALWPRPPATRLPPRASLVARSLGRGRRDGTPRPGPCTPLSREPPSPAPPPSAALRPSAPRA